MTFAQVLLLMAFGIAATQAACDGRAVTLRWLRLGDLIALCLCAVALAIGVKGVGTGMVGSVGGSGGGGVGTGVGEGGAASAWSLVVSASLFVVGFALHIALVQKSARSGQRTAILLLCALTAALTILPFSIVNGDMRFLVAGLSITGDALQMPLGHRIGLVLSGCVLGGALMTMLLGHAYLTAGGEMTQAPFLRVTAALFLTIVLRGVLSGAFAHDRIWSLMEQDAVGPPGSALWSQMLVTVRYLVGVLVPAVMVYMAWACVRIRSNQSATGILYVAGILLLIGELTALTLNADLGWPGI